jgi:uncharacterized repeat protein (TIGR01451 family)
MSAAMTLALSGLAIGSASAATPSWTMSVTSMPASVSVGADAGYRVTISNNGKSNISQVYLTDALVALDGTPAIPGTILSTTYAASTQGSCDAPGVRLTCSLGAIRSGRSASVTVAYASTSDPTFRRIFEANTTGVAGDKSGSSHGDVLQHAGTTLTGSGADFAGRFIIDQVLTVGNAPFGAGNNQSTSVNAPQGVIGVSVQDGTLGDACPTAAPCWSETSEIHVDNGAVYRNGFSAAIGIYKDLSQTVHGFYHRFDSPHLDGAIGEYVTATCPKSGTPSASQIPCLTVTKLSGGSVSIQIWLKENGTIRFN